MNKINAYQIDRNIKNIETLLSTVRDKLLPTLSDGALENSAPEGCSPEQLIDHAFPFVLIREDLINHSAVWLYHLFERAYDEISTAQPVRNIWDERRNRLKTLGIDTSHGSNFSAIQDELRLLANAYKHGDKSKSAKELHKRMPDQCTKTEHILFMKKTREKQYIYKTQPFSKLQLENYASKMINFWQELKVVIH